MPAGFGRLSLRIAPLKIDLFLRQPGLARARGEGKSLGRPNPRGAGGSWAAQCARHCQTVENILRDGHYQEGVSHFFLN